MHSFLTVYFGPIRRRGSVRAGCNGRNVSPSHTTALFAENDLRCSATKFDDIFSNLQSPLGRRQAAGIYQDVRFRMTRRSGAGIACFS